MADRRLTVGELIRHLRPGISVAVLPRWPPDAFALALTILRHADAYSAVVSSWPPGRRRDRKGGSWNEEIRRIGRAWRAAAATKAAPPREVAAWWRSIAEQGSTAVSRVRELPHAQKALLQVVAAADEASNRAGIWNAGESADEFRDASLDLLIERGSLADEIHASRAVVFPKLHTPQRGITARSLTHYLALHEVRDVLPKWFALPFAPRSSFAFNVLVLPWPRGVVPRDFRPAPGLLLNMPEAEVGRAGAYGFFTYAPEKPPVTRSGVRDALRRARALVGDIDAIAFPELALQPGQAEALCREFRLIVIGGEGRSSDGARPGSNGAAVSMPLARVAPRLAMSFVQPKHHRWCLDQAQVRSYGVGGVLDPSREWWEHIPIEQRELHFFELNDWLTFCVLICEDLARQEPVSELIRAVGPNLVIALLMDGPQLEHRWPAKYATVLAEDPGCSVLTLTSIGMALLSRPPGKLESRAIGLWKDPIAGAVQIDLPKGCDGVVLSLTRERTRERTADGRDDEWGSDYIRLNGIHPVREGTTHDIARDGSPS